MPLGFTEKIRAVKIGPIFLELMIVFVGVYAAFMLNDYRAERQRAEQRAHVVELMRVGIERYEKLFGGFALRHANANSEFRDQLARGEIPRFRDSFFVAPQYPIEVIDRVVTAEGYGVFPLDIYVLLVEFLGDMRRIMHTEEKLTLLAEASLPLPAEAHEDYDWIRARQRERAERHLLYMEARREISARLATKAKTLGEKLDALMKK